MLAVGLALLAALGFAATAIFARVGMQGVKPLPATLISLVVGLFPALLLALVFAMPDIRALTLAGYGWLLGLGALTFIGGRVVSYVAIDMVGASRSSAILGTGVVFATIFAIMAFAPMPMFSSYGILTAVMIFMAAAASLVVLPSLLFLVTPAKKAPEMVVQD